MTTFMDGPAAGTKLLIRRSPYFLRVVAKGGKFDALDQLTDEPDVHEQIFAYKLVKIEGNVHLNIRGKCRRSGGFYPMASYRLHHEQPNTEVFRSCPESRPIESARSTTATAGCRAKSSRAASTGSA